MLRLVGAVLRDSAKKVSTISLPFINTTETGLISRQVRCLSVLSKPFQWQNNSIARSPATSLLSESLTSKLLVQTNQPPTVSVPTRSINDIYYSLKNGKRKTVKTVLKRFYRLNWGIWIRTRAGRHKHLWKKSLARRRRLRQHVFCNATQSYMLDKMVTKFWKRPKYYVDDPYEPYHSREYYCKSQKKPRPLPED